MGPRIRVTLAADGSAVNVARMTDFEVLHAGRIYPDGNPAELIREQLQRVLRQAEQQGFVVLVQPTEAARHSLSVVTVPGRAD